MHTILRNRNHALLMEQELQDVPFDSWVGAERSIFHQFFPAVGRDSTLKFSTIRSWRIVSKPELSDFNIEREEDELNFFCFFFFFEKKHGSLRIHSLPKAAPALYQTQSSPVHPYTVPATPVRQAEADEPISKPPHQYQIKPNL